VPRSRPPYSPKFRAEASPFGPRGLLADTSAGMPCRLHPQRLAQGRAWHAFPDFEERGTAGSASTPRPRLPSRASNRVVQVADRATIVGAAVMEPCQSRAPITRAHEDGCRLELRRSFGSTDVALECRPAAEPRIERRPTDAGDAARPPPVGTLGECAQQTRDDVSPELRRKRSAHFAASSFSIARSKVSLLISLRRPLCVIVRADCMPVHRNRGFVRVCEHDVVANRRAKQEAVSLSVRASAGFKGPRKGASAPPDGRHLTCPGCPGSPPCPSEPTSYGRRSLQRTVPGRARPAGVSFARRSNRVFVLSRRSR